MPKRQTKIRIKQKGAFFIAEFQAMASPCSIHIETDSAELANKIAHLGAEEAWRIEKKFSRYRNDNLVHKINTQHKKPIKVDNESKKLFDFAQIAYELSEGLFDISSGIFRRVWDFKSKQFPAKEAIAKIKQQVGWNKISWQNDQILLPENMEIDLGGIAKEYAVDRVAVLLHQYNLPAMINFGGDLVALKPPESQPGWQIAIDDPYHTGQAHSQYISLNSGAIATSGDARNHVEFNGKRYGHIINPLTGYPPLNAPRSVTVAATTCIQAGLFSSLAILHGENAESFLKQSECLYWLVW